MVFQLGQTPFKSGKNHRVTAHNRDGVVAVTLGHGIARCLGVASGSKLRIAYNGKPGIWTWLMPRGRHPAGRIAGTANSDGYLIIKIDGRPYKAHRLAFLYMTGEWPNADVDHINRIKSDCRWRNLRQATRSQNIANTNLRKDNQCGFKGVSWHKKAGKWTARIQSKNSRINLGVFDSAEEAAVAYRIAAHKTYAEFAL